MDSVMAWMDRKPHRFLVVLVLQTILVVGALVLAMLRI